MIFFSSVITRWCCGFRNFSIVSKNLNFSILMRHHRFAKLVQFLWTAQPVSSKISAGIRLRTLCSCIRSLSGWPASQPVSGYPFACTSLVPSSSSVSFVQLLIAVCDFVFVVFSLLVSSAVTLGLYFVQTATQNLILSCIFEALTSLGISTVYCIMVDLFPTNLRWEFKIRRGKSEAFFFL